MPPQTNTEFHLAGWMRFELWCQQKKAAWVPGAVPLLSESAQVRSD
jgi:hypothetical protein